jgi:hypothetical protein
MVVPLVGRMCDFNVSRRQEVPDRTVHPVCRRLRISRGRGPLQMRAPAMTLRKLNIPGVEPTELQNI